MQYKYITENNLEHTQDYMYAEYRGLDFLKAYYQTRMPFLMENTEGLFALLEGVFSSGTFGQTDTGSHLMRLLRQLYTAPLDADRQAIDFYIQRFEVSKRLFEKYDPQTGKSVLRSCYNAVFDYVLLAAITERSYDQFHSLKFLSCLLKLNDTLLSLIPFKEDQMLLAVKMLVTREIKHVIDLSCRKNIMW